MSHDARLLPRVSLLLASALVAVSCNRSLSMETTSLTVKDGETPGTHRALFVAVPKETLTDAQVTFALPAECQAVAGAQLSQLPEMPAGKKLERSLEIRCGAGASGVVTVTLTAKRPDGGELTVKHDQGL